MILKSRPRSRKGKRKDVGNKQQQKKSTWVTGIVKIQQTGKDLYNKKHHCSLAQRISKT